MIAVDRLYAASHCRRHVRDALASAVEDVDATAIRSCPKRAVGSDSQAEDILVSELSRLWKR